MPYEIKEVYHDGTGKPFKIVEKDTGKVVGASDARDKAKRSIGYRMKAEEKKSK